MFRPPIEPLETRRLFSTYVVNTTADTVAVDGFVSLREAILAANTDSAVGDAAAGAGADVINFSAGLAGRKIHLTAGQFDITDALTISGRRVTLDAGFLSRVFSIDTSGSVQISNLFIANGYVNGAGGGVLVDGGGTTVLNSVTVKNCTSVGDIGGGIANLGQNLQINHAAFTGDWANGIDAHGGAIANAGGATTYVFHSLISGSTAQGFGGGVYNAGNLTLDRSTLHYNASYGVDRGGGGVANAGQLSVYGSIIQRNSAMGDAVNPSRGGGGLLNLGGLSSISNSWVRNNGSYAAAGGGIALYQGDITLAASIVKNNRASGGNGGGIAILSAGGGGNLTVDRCTISYNIADSGDGGGVAVAARQAVFSNTWIVHNRTKGGFFHGGGISDTGGTVYLYSSRVAYNTASGLSGGIDDLSVLNIHDSDVSFNHASGNGGGIGSYGTLTIDNTTINNNTAGQSSGAGGGGVAIFGTAQITNSWLWGNHTSGPGGGIYNFGTLDVLGLSVAHNHASDGGGVFSDSADGAVLTGFDASEYFHNSPNDASGF